MMRATVSTRPLGPGQIEVRTACKHAACRIGWQLGDDLTERLAVAASLFHHAVEQGCRCMDPLWPRYRTPEAPVDLAGMVQRFTTVWAGVEAQQRRHGYAVIDWVAAVRVIAGERAA